jgi:DNA polymerase I-like protein with 3'-5' exonuclease and polymerase domains
MRIDVNFNTPTTFFAMYAPVSPLDLHAMMQHEYAVTSAQYGAPKTSRLTAKQLAVNNLLPEGTDHDNAVEVYKFIMALPASATVAFDTETSYRPDIKSVMASQTALRFVQFCYGGKAVCSRVTAENRVLIQQAVTALLCDRDKVVLIHNAPFDLMVCDRFLGIPHTWVKAKIVDTLLLSQFVYLGTNPGKLRHGLGACLMRELGVVADKGAQSSDWRLPVEQDRWEYINNDVLYLEPLARALYKRLHAESPALLKGWERERLFVSGPATAMAINGFTVNRAKLGTDLAGVEHEIALKLTELTAVVGPDPTYAGAKAALEATIATKQAQIAKGGKRVPGAAEGALLNAQAKLAALSPNFKYRSNKDKLALLATLQPTLLRLHYQQAIGMIGEDSALKLDAVYFHELALKLEAKDNLADTESNSALMAEGILGDVQLAIDSYETAALAISKSAEDARALCANSPAKLQRMFEKIASDFADTATAARLGSCTATNWKLIRAVLSAHKDTLLPHEQAWLQVVDLFLKLAELSKEQSMLSAYMVLADTDPTNPKLRSSYRCLGAKTGRTSSTGPNLQNIKRGDTRKLFVASPGYRMAVYDASQIELRVAFALANELKGLAAFAAGQDLHTVTALLIWGAEFKRVLIEKGVATAAELEDPDVLYARSYYFFDDAVKLSHEGNKIKSLLKAFRQLAKSANFGLLYGAGWRGLQGYIFSSSGQMVSEEEARDLRDKFFAAYPDLAAWHKRLSDSVNRCPNYLAISDDTRRLMPPEWGDGGYQMNKDLKLTVAANTPVQGLACVILKNAANAIYDNIINVEGYKGVRLIASVHDELVFEFPIGLDFDWLNRDIQRTLYDASQHILLDGKVEIKYSGGLCDETNTWADK